MVQFAVAERIGKLRERGLMNDVLRKKARAFAALLASACLAASVLLPAPAWGNDAPGAAAPSDANATAATALEAGTPTPTAADGSAPTQAASGTIDIMHTNDMHGRYAASASCIGLSALKALVDRENPDVLLDAGDTFHGLSFATVEQGESIAQLMDALGYDATTPGNHDWSYGAARLKEIDEQHRFGVLAANVLDTAKNAYFSQPYLIKEVDVGNGTTVRVGILGVIDESFYTSTAAKNVSGVTFASSVDYANAAARTLKEDACCDVVVALTHNADPQAFAAKTANIDAVVAGHQHILMDKTVANTQGVGVPVVEAGYYLNAAGLLSLTVERDADTQTWRVTGHAERTFAPADTTGLSDAGVDDLIAKIEADEAEVLGKQIGTSLQAYPYSWEDIRVTDQALGHAITAAYLSATGADLAFENAGGIRGGIPAGTVTAGDMLSISPYGNTLATYTLSGADVLSMLEHSLEISAQCAVVYDKQKAAIAAGEDPYQYDWPGNSGSVLVSGGATLVIDWTQPEGRRITSATVGGSPLDATRIYTLATNSYIPGLSAEYPELARLVPVQEYGTCEQLLRDFVGTENWESQVYALSGTVTYKKQEEAKPADDEAAAPQPVDRSTLAATGDDAGRAAQAAAALAGLAAAVAAGGTRAAWRRKARNQVAPR